MIFSLKIGGPAGYGIKSAGIILGKSLLRQGYSIFGYSEYPSLIRGGHNTYQIEIGEKEILSASQKIDFLVALDELTLKTDLKYLKNGGILIYEKNLSFNFPKNKNWEIYPIPLTELAKQIGPEIVRNTIAIAASFSLLGGEFKILKEIIKKIFKNKEKIVKINQKAAEKGYALLKNKRKKIISYNNKKTKGKKVILTGNEAVALGALSGGCNFYCAYPMTPATSVLHYLAKKQIEADIIVHEPEDEIGGILQTIGASFSGARAMIGTSGGGFALMTESLSLSGMTEIPIVIFLSMRPAPATGLPTWTEQGDLNFALYSGHGDFPRAVFAPGDAEEAYYLTQHALNIAELYQIPVFVLSDKFLSESDYSIDFNYFLKNRIKIKRGKLIQKKIKPGYKRYLASVKDGVSPRTIPGVIAGEHIANSDEHNEEGLSVEGYDEDRTKQMEKRMRKLVYLAKNTPLPILYGPKKAKLTIVSWGSNKGPILDALRNSKLNSKINFFHFTHIYPLPAQKIKTLLSKSKNLLLIEQNYGAQFANYLKSQTGIEIKNKLLKYNGKPFFREELEEKILEIFKKIS